MIRANIQKNKKSSEKAQIQKANFLGQMADLNKNEFSMNKAEL